MVRLMLEQHTYQFRQTLPAAVAQDESTFSNRDEASAGDAHWRGVRRTLGFDANTLGANNGLLREVHFCQEFLEAWIRVNGVESGVLSEPIQAPSVSIGLVQPLKCPILVP